jgi:hypothetical protein
VKCRHYICSEGCRRKGRENDKPNQTVRLFIKFERLSDLLTDEFQHLYDQSSLQVSVSFNSVTRDLKFMLYEYSIKNMIVLFLQIVR